MVWRAGSLFCCGGLLPALLLEVFDELFGVFFQEFVDFVEERVNFFSETYCLLILPDGCCLVVRALVVGTRRLSILLLGHCSFPFQGQG